MLPVTRTTLFTIRPILHVCKYEERNTGVKTELITNFVGGVSNSTAPRLMCFSMGMNSDYLTHGIYTVNYSIVILGSSSNI